MVKCMIALPAGSTELQPTCIWSESAYLLQCRPLRHAKPWSAATWAGVVALQELAAPLPEQQPATPLGDSYNNPCT